MMEHKAFLLNFDSFDRELRSILEEALETRNITQLKAFVNDSIGEMRDPYEGEPLNDDWESLIETSDAHQYGDFALTKYYDPLADIGLGSAWESVQELIAKDPDLSESPVLGVTVGPSNEPFDPGKMGSYFQSNQQVHKNHAYLLKFVQTYTSHDVDSALHMLDEAMKSNTGLYITF